MPTEHRALRRIDIGQLSCGTKLLGHLCGREGRILIRAGQVLSDDHFALLSRRGSSAVYVGDDWPWDPGDLPNEFADPAEIMEALHRRRMARPGAQARRCLRHVWTVTLKLTIEEHSSEGYRQREIQVTTTDLSMSGFAFVYHQYVHPGTALQVCFHSLPDWPTVTAVVRNCVHIAAREHRVGVEFTKVARGA